MTSCWEWPRKKIIILGMSSPNGKALEHDIPGSAGQRLFAMSYLDEEEWLNCYERVNLIKGKVPIKQKWDEEKARRAAKKFKKGLRFNEIIVLGRQVWKALELPRDCRTVYDGNNTWHYLPHPSGRSLHYNDAKNRKQAGKLLRSVAK